METTAMKLELWKLYIKMQNLMAREEGQDLIEYALVVALIAFAATVGMGTLASDINNAFSTIGTTLTAATA
jgi:pilus assembly protein Flp/PilA